MLSLSAFAAALTAGSHVRKAQAAGSAVVQAAAEAMQVLDDVPVACALTASDGTVVAANAAYHRLLVAPGKRPPHPLDCRDDIDAGAPDGVSDPFAAFDGDGAKERPVAGIVPLRDHRSHRRLVLLGRVAMPGAGSRSRRRTIDALWTAVDLTEIEAARQAAEAATVRLTDMIETAPIGLFRADRRGRLLHANDTLADWLGVDAADLVARKAGWRSSNLHGVAEARLRQARPSRRRQRQGVSVASRARLARTHRARVKRFLPSVAADAWRY